MGGHTMCIPNQLWLDNGKGVCTPSQIKYFGPKHVCALLEIWKSCVCWSHLCSNCSGDVLNRSSHASAKQKQ